jgi:hypothetical protein
VSGTSGAPERRQRMGLAAAVVLALLVAVAGIAYAVLWSDEPPVIRLASVGGVDTTAEASMAADDVEGARDMAPWNPVEYDFVLADSARVDAGEAAAWRLDPPEDLRAAAGRLAERLGLDGLSESPYDPDGLHAGAQDGSGPALWVHARGDWSYSDPSGQPRFSCDQPGSAGGGSSASGEAPADQGDLAQPDADAASGEDVDAAVAGPGTSEGGRCEEPTPPSGVPSASEARSMATALFDQLDLPGSLSDLDVHADDWGAWVHGQLQVGGHLSGLAFTASYGGDGVLTSAGGTLTSPVKVADYPTVDAETAVERLADGSPGSFPGTVLRSPEAAGPDDAVTSDLVDEPSPRPLPLPAEGDGEVQVVTVTLVNVESTLSLVVDVDGAAWLVPAYRFFSDDGARWEVVAVADGYLDHDGPASGWTDEPAVPEPGIAEPGVVDPGVTDPPAPKPAPGEDEPREVDPHPGEGPGSPDSGIDPEFQALAEKVVGLAEAEAVDLVESVGGVARVVARDGETFSGTEDYRVDRINLRVEDGKVTTASIG